MNPYALKHFLSSTFYVRLLKFRCTANILYTVLPSSSTVSPGDSSCANNEPIMTIDAPNLIDLAMSPCVLIPPSAIKGLRAAFTTYV